jgi:Family of unknown function (DUF6917)
MSEDGAAEDGAAEDGAKRAVTATLVKVLLHRRYERGMTLEPYPSRCVRQGELHELVTTDQAAQAAGTRVDRVGFLGFAEITRAGVVDRGDQLWIGGRLVGTVLGFDACHYPNHYNILVHSGSLSSGADLGLTPELPVRFGPAPTKPALAGRAGTAGGRAR